MAMDILERDEQGLDKQLLARSLALKLASTKALSSVNSYLSSCMKPCLMISQLVLLLYADNLVIAAETLDELTDKFLMWKSSLESRGLRVSMKENKDHDIWP